MQFPQNIDSKGKSVFPPPFDHLYHYKHAALFLLSYFSGRHATISPGSHLHRSPDSFTQTTRQIRASLTPRHWVEHGLCQYLDLDERVLDSLASTLRSTTPGPCPHPSLQLSATKVSQGQQADEVQRPQQPWALDFREGELKTQVGSLFPIPKRRTKWHNRVFISSLNLVGLTLSRSFSICRWDFGTNDWATGILQNKVNPTIVRKLMKHPVEWSRSPFLWTFIGFVVSNHNLFYRCQYIFYILILVTIIQRS